MRKWDRRRVKPQPKFCLRKWQRRWEQLLGIPWTKRQRSAEDCLITPLKNTPEI